MSHESIDTRATAYVFGELSADQTAAFEQEMESSDALREEVAEIREALAAITAEFDAESTGVNESNRKEIEQAIGTAVSPACHEETSRVRRAVAIVVALAAGVLIVAGLVYPNLRQPEIDTTALSEPTSAGDREQVYNKSASVAIADEADTPRQVQTKGSSIPTSESLALEAEVERLEQVVEERKRNVQMLSKKTLGFAPPTKAPAEMSVNLDDSSVVKNYRVEESELSRATASLAEAADELKQLQAQRAVAQPKSAPAASSAVQARGLGVAVPTNDVAAAPVDSLDTKIAATQPFAEAAKGKAADFDVAGGEPSQLLVRPHVIVEGVEEELKAQAESFGVQREEMIAGKKLGRGGQADGLQSSDSEADRANLSRLSLLGGVVKADHDNFVRTKRFKSVDLDSMNENADLSQGIGAGEAGDRHDPIEDNPFMEVDNAPMSTFSIDVDTAAYAKVRMYLLQQSAMPRPAAVRIEELVNYFDYDYKPPTDEHPFSATMDIAGCPWNPEHRLARIGIKGKVIEEQRPSSNLVFLLDVSGSMNRSNKLPLVIDGMKLLTDQLTENDSVAIVVYAGAAGMVLDSTSGDQKQVIHSALERLKAGGSTNGGQGITLAYQIARDNFIVGGTNRVILCSDGDFNVGVTGTDELVRIAEENAKSNIYLSVLGFGMGNHNDAMMETISNKGNGNYAFIDGIAEANKVLVEEMGGTLVTIAKDVKIQVEFNPKEIAAYRLIGYENRIMAAQDFNDDTKDAGEIGAGHTVTALYELIPAGAETDVTILSVDDLRYQKKSKLTKQASSGEVLNLKLRYKSPDSQPGAKSTLVDFPVTDSGKEFSEMDRDFQFAASVASFGMLLRNSPHKGDSTFAAVEEIAGACVDDDASGFREEFLQMVRKAKQLRGE